MNSVAVARRCCALAVAWALLISAVVPAPVLADDGGCSGEGADSCRSRSGALRLKAVAIASILTAGAVGVCIPIAGKKMSSLSSDGGLFFVVKAFAAGVILATAFVHVLPDAFESLSNACLSDNITRFPLAGLFAMVSALATLMVDAMATSYYQKSHFGRAAATAAAAAAEEEGNGEVKNNVERVFEDSENGGGHGQHKTHLHTHSHATHGHAHGSSTVHQDSNAAAEKIRHKIISQVLEAGIIAHSVIIGLSLGTSESPCTIRPLLVALTFHQFFEGIGLGGCIMQAGFKRRSTAVMALFFSITTPLGIAVGIGVSSSYNDNSPTALIVEGVLNSASAGILIYMALVDLLAADFLNSGLQRRPLLQLFGYTSLLLGSGAMALLAVWA